MKPGVMILLEASIVSVLEGQSERSPSESCVMRPSSTNMEALRRVFSDFVDASYVMIVAFLNSVDVVVAMAIEDGVRTRSMLGWS